MPEYQPLINQYYTITKSSSKPKYDPMSVKLFPSQLQYDLMSPNTPARVRVPKKFKNNNQNLLTEKLFKHPKNIKSPSPSNTDSLIEKEPFKKVSGSIKSSAKNKMLASKQNLPLKNRENTRYVLRKRLPL